MSYSSVKIKNRGQHNINKHLKPVREWKEMTFQGHVSLLLKPFRGFHLNSPTWSYTAHSCLCLQPYLTSLNSCYPGLFPVPRANQTIFPLRTSYLQILVLECSCPLCPRLTPVQTWHLTSNVRPSRRASQNPQRGKKYCLLCLWTNEPNSRFGAFECSLLQHLRLLELIYYN